MINDMKISLPQSLKSFIGNQPLQKDKVGQSPSDVYSFTKNNEKYYLKTTELTYAQTTYSVIREAKMLVWLDGKLNVPELVLMDTDHENEYMISKAVPAKPLQDFTGKSDQFFIDIYTDALAQLQSISIKNCPFISNKKFRLAEADFFLENGLLDELDDDEKDLTLWSGYQNFAELLDDLKQQDFQEEYVFSHGDLTDSNVFLSHDAQIYFLDVGRAGIADRFVDIAFIERSLREDCSEDAALQFLNHLAEDDAFKRNYFLKLDELN